MKTTDTALWRLLHSLSPAEKRYCKLHLKAFTTKKEKYVKLLDSLLKMKTFDEQRLRKKMATEFPDPGQLANGKHFLQEQVHRALLSFHRKHEPDFLIRDNLSLGALLMKKGFMEQGRRILEQAIEMSREHEHPELLLEGLRIKFSYLRNAGSRSNFVKEAPHILSEIHNLIQEIGNSLQTYRNGVKLHLIGDRKGMAEYSGEIPSLEFWKSHISKLRLFRNRVYAASVASWMFQTDRQHKNANYFLDWEIEHYRQNPKWQENNYPSYSAQLMQKGIQQFADKDWAGLKETESLLQELHQKMSRHHDKVNLELLLLRQQTLKKLWLAFAPNAPGTKVEPLPLPKKRTGSLAEQYRLSIRSLDTFLLVREGQFSRALSLVNETLGLFPPGYLEQGKVTLRFFKACLLFLEGEIELLDRELDNLRRKLRQFPRQAELFRPYLNLLVRLTNTTNFQKEVEDFLASTPPITLLTQKVTVHSFNEMLKILMKEK